MKQIETEHSYRVINLHNVLRPKVFKTVSMALGFFSPLLLSISSRHTMRALMLRDPALSPLQRK